MTNYHIINRVDDALIYVSNTPQQLKNNEVVMKAMVNTWKFIEQLNVKEHALRLASASPEDWGKTIEKLVRISVLAIVLIGVITLDVATFMYQAGHAFGQLVHSLNNKLTDVTRSVMLWYSKDDQYDSLDVTDNTTCCVRKSTQTYPTINSWQLQLPIPALKKLGTTSPSTTTTTITKENQPLSPSTKTPCITEGQKKEVGTMNQENPSNASVSSVRSKRSVQRSSSSKKQRRSTEANVINTAGSSTASASSKGIQKHSRRSARTTADNS